MPNVEVICTVSNCVFHDRDNLCGAAKIVVDMNEALKKDAEFGFDFDLRNDKAKNSVDTCCKTFKPKF